MSNPKPPVYLACDLWDALGASFEDFDAYYERNGWANTWANLLGVVRDHFKPKCGQLVDGESCTLTAGHLPPHYGPSDVGSSEPIPVSPSAITEAQVVAGAAALMKDDPEFEKGTYGVNDYLAMSRAVLDASRATR